MTHDLDSRRVQHTLKVECLGIMSESRQRHPGLDVVWILLFRDLKLDNTLLDGKRPGRVKLCDFGFAKQWEQENRNMFTHIG